MRSMAPSAHCSPSTCTCIFPVERIACMTSASWTKLDAMARESVKSKQLPISLLINQALAAIADLSAAIWQIGRPEQSCRQNGEKTNSSAFFDCLSVCRTLGNTFRQGKDSSSMRFRQKKLNSNSELFNKCSFVHRPLSCARSCIVGRASAVAASAVHGR